MSSKLHDAQQNDDELKFIYSVLLNLSIPDHPNAKQLRKLIDRHRYIIDNDFIVGEYERFCLLLNAIARKCNLGNS